MAGSELVYAMTACHQQCLRLKNNAQCIKDQYNDSENKITSHI
jgi:hypothetical protein